jgi:hypothetical protein
MDLRRNREGGKGWMDSFSSGYELLTVSCKHGDESSGSLFHVLMNFGELEFPMPLLNLCTLYRILLGRSCQG